MIPFPDISPEIFSIELFGINLALRWYAVSYILGFICALKLMIFFVVRKTLWASEKPPLSTDQADSFLTYLILGVIIGTYSSMFVASPILKYFKVSYKTLEKEEEKILP